jgi:glyoxylase-like metal-dependent hydrolase (beta-lactamase superfamily II)/ferredoxin
MARLALRLAENAPGTYYVDASCIDCGVCREVAPGLFAASPAGRSFVARQPSGPAEARRAGMALVACPTASIGACERVPMAEAVAAFPEPLGGGVYFCGFASERSYGAQSYLIVRPGGNVLVDSPRAAGPLFRAIERLGGVRVMFLTHRDDVADHEAFRRRFGCERVLHERDATAGTRGVERIVRGDDPIALGEGLEALPVPGHTAGSMALVYEGLALFSGDHLAGAPGGGLEAWPDLCWHSWPEQRRSLARLLTAPFSWVLPGHGTRARAPSVAAMHGWLRALLRRLP